MQERHAILTIRDGSKLDTGPYRLQAENDLGMDSAIIKIQISGMYLIYAGRCLQVVFQFECEVLTEISWTVIAVTAPVKRDEKGGQSHTSANLLHQSAC